MPDKSFINAGLRGIDTRARRAALLVAVAVLMSGCVTTMGTGAPAVDAGNTAATQPKVGLDPDYRALLLAHGERALEGAKYDEASAAYKRILDAEPRNAEATFGMAETMLASGNQPAALNFYRALGKDESFKARALQGEGIALLNFGQHAQSIEALQAAVVADPSLWRAWNGLGRTLDAQGKHDEARASYDRALTVAPDAATVLNNRGVSNMLAGRYVEAEADLRKAIAIDRDLERVRGNLRLALAWQGKYVEALTDVARINAPMALNNIGYIAMKRGDLNHAEAYFAQAMQLSPAFYDKADRNLRFLHEMRKLQSVADLKKS
jgi:Flp pilus assembly protein TadD